DERTRPAAQTGPGQRRGPGARIFVGDPRGRESRLSLVGQPGGLQLHTLEERRLVEDRIVITTPQRIALRQGWPARGFCAVAANWPCNRSTTSCTRRASVVVAEPARVAPRLFTTTDDRGRRAPATDRADVPQP